MSLDEKLAELVMAARGSAQFRSTFATVTALGGTDEVYVRMDMMETGAMGPLPVITGKLKVGDRALATYLPDQSVWVMWGKGVAVSACGIEAVSLETVIAATSRTDTFYPFYVTSSAPGETNVYVEHSLGIDVDVVDLEVGLTDVDGHEYGGYADPPFGVGPPFSFASGLLIRDGFGEVSAGGTFGPPNAPDGSLRPYTSTHDRLGNLLTPEGVNQQAGLADSTYALGVDVQFGAWVVGIDATLGMGTEPIEQAGFFSGEVRVTRFMRAGGNPFIKFVIPSTVPVWVYVRWDRPRATYASTNMPVVDWSEPDGFVRSSLFLNEIQVRQETAEFLMVGEHDLGVFAGSVPVAIPTILSAYCGEDGPPGAVWSDTQSLFYTLAPVGTVQAVLPFNVPFDTEEIGAFFTSSVLNARARRRLYAPGNWEVDQTINNSNFVSSETFNFSVGITGNGIPLRQTNENTGASPPTFPAGLWNLVIFSSNATAPSAAYTVKTYYRPWPVFA